MGKYKLTTIRTTLATSKRLNQLKKQIGAKSIDELLTTLMNMYKIKEFSEEDLQQLSVCNDLITPLIHKDLISYPIVYEVQDYVSNSLIPGVNDVDAYLRTHDLLWKGGQVVGIDKEQTNENN